MTQSHPDYAQYTRILTVSVDFDGVLHSYKSPRDDAATIPDEPVPGAIDWLARLMAHFNVVISSSRNHQAGGITAMREWLLRNGLAWYLVDRIEFPLEKAPAFVHIDDRAMTFNGVFPTIDEILAFRPWNKRPATTTIPSEKIERIARVAHEVNRAYCQSMGDYSQLPWDDAPLWQKASAEQGVAFRLANPTVTPAGMHQSWLDGKAAEGWKYGPVKDAAKKEHPCFVPYAELPPEQQAKDYLFRAVVDALK